MNMTKCPTCGVEFDLDKSAGYRLNNIPHCSEACLNEDYRRIISKRAYDVQFNEQQSRANASREPEPVVAEEKVSEPVVDENPVEQAEEVVNVVNEPVVVDDTPAEVASNDNETVVSEPVAEIVPEAPKTTTTRKRKTTTTKPAVSEESEAVASSESEKTEE